jgi:hypothetical protein
MDIMNNTAFLNKLDELIKADKLESAVDLIKNFARDNYKNSLLADVSCKFADSMLIKDLIEEYDLTLIGLDIEDIQENKYYVWFMDEEIQKIMVVDELTQEIVRDNCEDLFLELC